MIALFPSPCLNLICLLFLLIKPITSYPAEMHSCLCCELSVCYISALAHTRLPRLFPTPPLLLQIQEEPEGLLLCPPHLPLQGKLTAVHQVLLGAVTTAIGAFASDCVVPYSLVFQSILSRVSCCSIQSCVPVHSAF